jgi:hypothetical protein
MLNRLIVASVVTGAWGPGAARKIALAKPSQFHIINQLTIIGFIGKERRHQAIG